MTELRREALKIAMPWLVLAMAAGFVGDERFPLAVLYGRICFNVLCGNTDDHARNHAAFWDGRMLTLTPAYDICPQGRTGNEATQAMLIKGGGRASTLATLLAAAPDYHLKEAEASALIEHQVTTMAHLWQEVCDEAELSPVDSKLFAGRQFLNSYVLDGLDVSDAQMAELFAIDPTTWLAECDLTEEYFAQFGERLPTALTEELEALRRRIAEAS